MKILKLLEMAQEDSALITIAKALGSYLSSKTIRIKWEEDKNNGQLLLGNIERSLRGTGLEPLLDKFPEPFRRITLGFRDMTNADIGGHWNANKRSIFINPRDLESEDASYRLTNTLVHELRHALDDFKSGFVANTSQKYTKQSKLAADENTAYLSQPNEMNARYAEALHYLSPAIEKWKQTPPSTDELHKTVVYALKQHHIAQLFPEKERSPQYRRFINRIIDYIQKSINGFNDENT